jgi:1-acyl-sn-glycerol-3-phosphate acyltransferase
MKDTFYWIAIFFIRLYIRSKFKYEVKGLENVPKKGGLVLVSNHMSNYDPCVLGITCPRAICFFAKKELFCTKFKDFWLRQLKAFPVDRSITDMNALKNSIKLIKSGEVLGIFAQGKRVKEGEDAEAKGGVALFALKGNCDVLPVHISADYTKKGSTIKVNYGEPISLEKYKGMKLKTELLNEVASNIMDEVERLGEEE